MKTDVGGWILGILGVVGFIVLLFVLRQNTAECVAKHCERGVPRIVEYQCLCVEKPK